jgi:hypothetical protein
MSSSTPDSFLVLTVYVVRDVSRDDLGPHLLAGLSPVDARRLHLPPGLSIAEALAWAFDILPVNVGQHGDEQGGFTFYVDVEAERGPYSVLTVSAHGPGETWEEAMCHVRGIPEDPAAEGPEAVAVLGVASAALEVEGFSHS